ncbi:MAG: glycosyltransferase family 9 protein [Planctomycetes bacterium]|nr:glycosyltransferase family 9 protein [Planctomycetota bacterium]
MTAPRAPDALPPELLVVRLGAIGDVVNALTLASALRAWRPELRVGWAVHELAAPLVVGHPDVARVHVWRRGHGLAGFRAVVREIRAARYELALDVQRLAKSSILARLSGARRVVGFDRARCKESSWLWTTERIAPGPRSEHMVEQYLSFARHLGAPAPRAIHRLPSTPEAEARAAQLVARLGGAPVVIGIGASKPVKRWPPERYGALARALVRTAGVPVCFVGGPGDRADAQVARATAGPEVHDLVGTTTLVELAALLRRARLFLGGDTGPMHLAVASGSRVVCLFGPGDPRRTGPYGAGHRLVRVVPRGADPLGIARARIEDIDVELALAEARAALGA